jgi:2-hydroxychromene-2-carboxylate isomerase
MPDPIRFYFDFASPYAYFAATRIDALAKSFGRTVEWRPILLWAVFRAHGVAPPMDVAVRRDYLLHDMARSADFFGVPYRAPAKLALSTHLAARLYHAISETEPSKAVAFANRVFAAFFVEQKDISQSDTLLALAADAGIDADAAAEGMTAGRPLLEQAVAGAIADKVVGSPFFLVDGEGFFGADRLPQLRWFLEKPA